MGSGSQSTVLSYVSATVRGGAPRLRIIGRAHTGRLIEVWLQEESSDYWLVRIAFEAGLAGQVLFRRLIRE
jgi:hypothetical protein